ncbi:MAG TPA: ATP-dependent DNA helicase, partial [Acidimicrobiales bacterium]|nr:ATP-dependent DNA helicase [Acidimicrobiales bacterium]
MAEAVARSIEGGRHLVVQAGTGTGKSLAYLVPAILSRRQVVVATATLALQDQLAHHDLPLLEAGLEVPFTFAVLKGRSNYLCRQRAAEVQAGRPGPRGAEDRPPPPLPPRDPSGAGEAGAPTERDVSTGPRSALGAELRRLLAWAARSSTGDRAELDAEPSARAWAQLSVSAQECPGRSRCPSGDDCFAEAARDRAAQADVVVVNMHLYSADLASGRSVLPDHEVVVFDEAHELEDVATLGLGLELSRGRLRAMARLARGLLASSEAGPAGDLEHAGDRLEAALSPWSGRRLPPDLGEDVGAAVALAAERLRTLTAAVRQAGAQSQGQGTLDLADRAGALADPTRTRALLAAGTLAGDLATAMAGDPDRVAWVEERAGGALTLRLAPIEVGPVLAKHLWGEVTAVLTSATIPAGLPARLGLPADKSDELDVGSPFP